MDCAVIQVSQHLFALVTEQYILGGKKWTNEKIIDSNLTQFPPVAGRKIYRVYDGDVSQLDIPPNDHLLSLTVLRRTNHAL